MHKWKNNRQWTTQNPFDGTVFLHIVEIYKTSRHYTKNPPTALYVAETSFQQL